MTRVALDLLGGDSAPAAVVDGALLAAERMPDVEMVLVGPVDLAERRAPRPSASPRGCSATNWRTWPRTRP